MAKGPLAFFRRHQRWMMVIIVVASILAFTIGSVGVFESLPFIGPLVSGQGSASDVDNPVVVRWSGGDIRESDIQAMRLQQGMVAEFTQVLAYQAGQQGGMRRAEPVQQATTDEDLLQTVLFAHLGEKEGLIVSDTAIDDYLNQLTDSSISGEEMMAMFRQVTRGFMNKFQLYSTLRQELLARNYLNMGRSGLAGQTPDEVYNYFCRLHRRVSAELLPLEVDEFLDSVKEQPTEAELLAFFEKYKFRYPNDLDPEPGFKRPRLVSFEYVLADFNVFMEEELPKVTDEEVLAYYEAHKEDYRTPELPSESDFPSSTTPDTTTPDTTTPDDSTPDTTTPDTTTPDPTTPGDGAAPDKAASPDATDAPAPPTTDPDKGSPPDAAPGPGNDDAGGSPGQDETSAAAPADAGDTSAAPADTGAPADAGDAGASAGQEEDPRQAIPRPPVPDVVDDEPAPEAERPEYRALEDVKPEIRRAIASPRAQVNFEKAYEEARRVMSRYFSDLVAWQTTAAKDESKKPPKPDLEKLADQLNLTPGEVPLVSAARIAEKYGLGESYRIDRSGTGFGGRQTFPQFAFIEGLPDYKADTSEADGGDLRYVYWKTGEKEEYVPKLEDVREEVIRAWKEPKALELAKKRAEEMAKRAGSSSLSLKEAFPQLSSEIIDTPEFSWMMTFFSGDQPFLSPIEGVEGAGHDFREAVFALHYGEVGVAVNDPKSVVYVVRIRSESPTTTELREQFMEDGMSLPVMYVAFGEMNRTMTAWYQNILEQLDVQWMREPGVIRNN